MADPAGLYIATSGGVFWSGRHQYGGAITNPVSDFVLRTTKPTAANTGLPAGWAPKQTFTTAQNFTQGGQVVEDIDFACEVNLQSTGNIFNRCRFRGTNSAMGRPMVYAIHAGCNSGPANQLNFCEVAPQYASNTNDCMMGYNVTTYRSNFFHGVDTFGSNIPYTIGSNARILHQGSYFHDLAYFCPDVGGQSSGQTHNDVNQLHNGTNIVYEGCNLEGFWAPDFGVGALDPGVFHYAADGKTRIWDSGNANSPGVANGPRNCNGVLQMNVINTVGDFHAIYNWISGGISSINALDTSLSGFDLELVGNRFEAPLGGKNAILNCYSANSVILTASGNTLNGAALSMAVGDGRANKT